MTRVAGLSVAAVLLTVPLAAQAQLVRTADSPPLEGASTMTATPPADPPDGQVVTIIVPAEPEGKAPPESKPKEPVRAPAQPATPPPPPPVSPPVSSSRPPAETVTRAPRARGGASRAVALPAARGGRSSIERVVRSRQPASLVSAVLASRAQLASPDSHGVSRALIVVLGGAAFAEALLLTRMLRRRRLADPANI
jgi:hypothetical protein